MSEYHSDYENEPIGGGNPYYRCVHCKLSDPAINGRIQGHASDCVYRLAKELGTPYPPTEDVCSLMFTDGLPWDSKDSKGCRLPEGHSGHHEFVAADGRVWCWETDLTCTCDHCMRFEGDYCVTYWEKKET